MWKTRKQTSTNELNDTLLWTEIHSENILCIHKRTADEHFSGPNESITALFVPSDLQNRPNRLGRHMTSRGTVRRPAGRSQVLGRVLFCCWRETTGSSLSSHTQKPRYDNREVQMRPVARVRSHAIISIESHVKGHRPPETSVCWSQHANM